MLYFHWFSQYADLSIHSAYKIISYNTNKTRHYGAKLNNRDWVQVKSFISNVRTVRCSKLSKNVGKCFQDWQMVSRCSSLKKDPGKRLFNDWENQLRTRDVWHLTQSVVGGWWLICLFAVMQTGFAFLEAGSVRSKNTTNILIKNFLDVCKYLLKRVNIYRKTNSFKISNTLALLFTNAIWCKIYPSQFFN